MCIRDSIITVYYVAIIFHHQVWYRVLALRYACIQHLGIILISWATFVSNIISFVTFTAELAHREKSCTQSLTQLIWCRGNRSTVLQNWIVIYLGGTMADLTEPPAWILLLILRRCSNQSSQSMSESSDELSDLLWYHTHTCTHKLDDRFSIRWHCARL